jgi:4-hydroxybenzoate polyprenyltransferase
MLSSVPSGRITTESAMLLRYVLAAVCILCSFKYDHKVAIATCTLLVTTFLYDEGGLANHPIGKNFCNIGGYASFETGATIIMSEYLS